jgi:two-component system CheB/CheR fusion protein
VPADDKTRPKSRSNNQAKLERNSPPAPLIVGMGASAGGLTAFKSFFKHMPADSGMAFVLVQHLDPDHDSMLAELLGACTEMPVAEAKDGAELLANHVFTIPRDATLTIKNGRLAVETPAPPRANRHPIDTFFIALAEDQGENAVCVVLSGAGSDGTLGLRKIKEYGGFALAQEGIGDIAAGGMPASASATGLVDYSVRIEEMPERLIDYQHHLHRVEDRKSADGTRSDAVDYLDEITTLVRDGLGHDFSEYKQNTLIRRVQRRMQVLQIDAVPEYIERLKSRPDELQLLFEDLLIGVTQFFRDPESWEALEQTVIPALFEGKTAANDLRIWVPACGTGEEVYSIAILLCEAMAQRDGSPKVQVFGTDLDERAIEFARTGTYRKALPGLPEERRKKFFTSDGEGNFKPAKAVRSLCVFAAHSVTKDPPFSRLDLISCRNLLIYMNNDLQDRVLRKFQYALKPCGWLFLGTSEGVSRNTGRFETVDKKHRLYRRRDTDETASIPDMLPAPASAKPQQRRQDSHREPTRPPSENVLDRDAQRIMQKHATPYVVIDAKRHILRFSGGAIGAYLEPSPGAASFELLTMVKNTLRQAVGSAVQQAFAAGEAVVKHNLPLRIDRVPHHVTVIVEPLDPIGAAGVQHCVVAFQDAGPGSSERPQEAGGNDAPALEHELHVTKAQLNAAIADLQTANEEMRSTNEEYQSVNEELQSSNEELETSREEMQSVNEELQTVNAELTDRSESLSKANSDLRNLLESTQIATLFLDTDLKIKSFTPGMEGLFHLREGDRGRPVTDIATQLNYTDIKRDANSVLRDLNLIEHEVELTGDEPRTFIMRIRPYRTVENIIDGIVITFTDITQRKDGEAERAHLAALVTASHDAIIGHSLEGKVLSWNAAAEQLFGHPPDEAINRALAELVPGHKAGEGEIPALLEKLKRGEPVIDYELTHHRNDGNTIHVELTISPITNERGEVTAAATVARDVSARLAHEAHRDLLMHELSHRVKNTLSTVQSMLTQTAQNATDVDQFTGTFAARLRALSDTHNLLTRAHWQGVGLRDVVVTELKPYGGGREPQWDVDGETVTIAPNEAIALGLAVHELATNAAKYGALCNDDGHIDIRWTLEAKDDSRWLHFKWAERGGPRVKQPERSGFGSRLITEGLSYELDAEVNLDFAAGGVRCTIDVPLKPQHDNRTSNKEL